MKRLRHQIKNIAITVNGLATSGLNQKRHRICFINQPKPSSLIARTRISWVKKNAAAPKDAPCIGNKLIVIDPEKVANNAKVNGVVFQFLAIVAGIVCGCLGLTDLKGFAAFGPANVAIGGAVVAKCGFKPSKYFIGIDKVVVDGASLGFGTFVLFWTLFYNICHLF